MALASIIGGGNKVPRVYMKVTFGTGPRSAGSAGKKVLLFGNKTSAGAANDEEVYAVGSDEDAVSLFGAGSELHLDCVAALANFKTIQLYAIAVPASAGAVATGTFVFTGASTIRGGLEFWIGETRLVLSVAVGDAAATVATALAALINAQTNLPVTAAAVAGTVTVTARHAGPRCNYIRIESTGSVAGVTHTNAVAFLASGATMDDPQNALDVVAAERYHYLVTPYQTATELAMFKAHVLNGAEPEEGERARIITASTLTLAATTALAVGLNESRGQIVWHQGAFETPGAIAARAAADLASAYERTAAFNTDGLRVKNVLPQRDKANYPTAPEMNSALNNGITPLRVNAGIVEIVRSVTTRSQDDAANPDFAVIDTHYVEVSDFMADDIEVNFTNVFKEHILEDDIEGEMPDPGVVTPAVAKDFILQRLSVYAAGGSGTRLLTNVAALADQIIVEIDGNVAGRINGSIPIDPVELLHQSAFDIRQL